MFKLNSMVRSVAGQYREGVPAIYKGTSIIDGHDVCSVMYKDGVYKGFYPEKLVKIKTRLICPECGIDYKEDDMEEHLRLVHGIPVDEQVDSIDQVAEFEEQAQEELNQIDEYNRFKCEQYDRICSMLFASCGIVEDGDSIKYIIDPETVADELLRIIVDDSKIERQTLVDAKKKRFKEVTAW